MGDTEFNLALAFDAVAEAVPDREAIVWRDRRLSFGQVSDRSHRLGTYLHRQGLGAHRARSDLEGHESGQDHIGLYLYNGNEYLEGMLGSYQARVAPFNVNYRYVEDELRYLLSNATCRGLIYHESFAPMVAAVRDDVEGLDVLIQVADGSGHDLLPGAVDYEATLAATSPALEDVTPHPDDLYIVYTGGTTGMPKGVLWRQHDIFMSCMGGRNILTWEAVSSYQQLANDAAAVEVPLKFMPLPPLMHGAAQWATFIGLNAGNTIVMQNDTRKLDPVDVWSTVEREQATTITTVGDALARPLVEELERAGDSYDVSSMIAIGNGGAPLTPTIKERLLVQLPNIILSDSVGASETGAQASHLSTAGAVDSGKFNPGPGSVVVSESLERLLAVGDDEIGWLAQEGWVPLGYYGDPDKTAQTFPVIDGVRYAVPGDRARWQANGEMELLGRDSVTINSGGEKIFAEEVERAIAGHPAVHDVIVVGRANERWGHEVVALVELAEGQKATPESIVEHAGAHIARYKLPKDVLFLGKIQRSPSGKADYRWARAQVE